MSQVPEDTIPDDMSALVHDAAAALPIGDYALERIVRRRRSHRRRTVTTLALLSVVVMAVATALPVALRATGAERAGAEAEAGQRLYYYAPFGPDPSVVMIEPGTPVEASGLHLRVPRGITELDGDGNQVRHVDLGDRTYQHAVVGRPDGGLVVLHDRSSDYRLSVVRPDGVEWTSRSLGPLDGPRVRLLGVDGGSAYLLRDRELVQRDLASDEEKPAAAAERVAELVGQGWTVDSLVSGRILLVKPAEDGGGRLMVLTLSGRERTTAPLGCALDRSKVAELRLSPDGRHLACWDTTSVTAHELSATLVVTDLTTGRPALRHDFPANSGLSFGAALAWTDNRTLQVAHFWLPPGQRGTLDLLDLVKVETFRP